MKNLTFSIPVAALAVAGVSTAQAQQHHHNNEAGLQFLQGLVQRF